MSRRRALAAEQMSLLDSPRPVPFECANVPLGHELRLDDGRLWRVVYNGGGEPGWWGANPGWLDGGERLAFLDSTGDAKRGNFDRPAVILRLDGAAVWTSAPARGAWPVPAP